MDKLVLSVFEFDYFNQKEEWVPFESPGQTLENRSHVGWQAEQGGLRSALDAQGRFALIRLLERAKVAQRSDAGAGLLDVLKLRRFALPVRIFVMGSANAGQKVAGSSPPPLPPAALAAAKHAAIPLPYGAVPDVE